MSTVTQKRCLIIITGASRGFGKSIALRLCDSHITHVQPTDMILTARSLPCLEETRQQAYEKWNAHYKKSVETTQELGSSQTSTSQGLSIHTRAIDFSSQRMDTWLRQLLMAISNKVQVYSHVFLFNNAGSLGNLSRVRNQQWQQIKENVDVNVVAPFVLTSALLRWCDGFDFNAAMDPHSSSRVNPMNASDKPRFFIINVSSLAAVQPFDTWGLYASCKAARDMFYKTIALEETLIESEYSSTVEPVPTQPSDTTSTHTRIRVLNYAPGPLDTDMQTQIRQQMPDVPTRDVFVKMHEEGNLVDPYESADVLVSLLEKDDFENGSHVDYYDVKDLPRGDVEK